MSEITEHLIGLGHRSFAVCIQPTRDNDRVQARVAGIRSALERHGLAVRPEHMLEGESTIGFGRRSLRSIWQSPGERPTAIICGNDHIALGVLREAEELGIAIPGELSVTGFDDLAIAKEMRPALTTMRVDTAEIGRLAAQHCSTRSTASGQRVDTKYARCFRCANRPGRVRLETEPISPKRPHLRLHHLQHLVRRHRELAPDPRDRDAPRPSQQRMADFDREQFSGCDLRRHGELRADT